MTIIIFKASPQKVSTVQSVKPETDEKVEHVPHKPLTEIPNKQSAKEAETNVVQKPTLKTILPDVDTAATNSREGYMFISLFRIKVCNKLFF